MTEAFKEEVFCSKSRKQVLPHLTYYSKRSICSRDIIIYIHAINIIFVLIDLISVISTINLVLLQKASFLKKIYLCLVIRTQKRGDKGAAHLSLTIHFAAERKKVYSFHPKSCSAANLSRLLIFNLNILYDKEKFDTHDIYHDNFQFFF